jgi:hypothetical protein
MGFSIHSEDYLFDGYLSYNFSVDEFSKYWYIRKHLVGHKASTILKYLKIAINEMSKNEISPSIPIGMDGWSRDIRVFMNHLKTMKDQIEELILKYPGHKNVRYWTDSASGENEEEYPDVVSEPDDDEVGDTYQYEEPTVYTYFRHPIKGNMKIDTFAKASEIYTLLVLKGSSEAEKWLELAKMMPDAPNN